MLYLSRPSNGEGVENAYEPRGLSGKSLSQVL